MNAPRSLAYLALFLACNGTVTAQQNSISTLPSSLYLQNGVDPSLEAVKTENLSWLTNALKAVELEAVLNESGPFTLFAPSDSAFSRLSEAALNVLLHEDNRAKLKRLLTYHMVAGELTASKILLAMCRGEGKASFTTVQGKKIIATMQGTDIILTDSLGNSARITAADRSNFGNGVVHEIDSVIMPTRI